MNSSRILKKVQLDKPNNIFLEYLKKEIVSLRPYAKAHVFRIGEEIYDRK